MIVALVGYINGNSIAFIRILAGENTIAVRLRYILAFVPATRASF
jgi:hypothetical protein